MKTPETQINQPIKTKVGIFVAYQNRLLMLFGLLISLFIPIIGSILAITALINSISDRHNHNPYYELDDLIFNVIATIAIISLMLAALYSSLVL